MFPPTIDECLIHVFNRGNPLSKPICLNTKQDIIDWFISDTDKLIRIIAGDFENLYGKVLFSYGKYYSPILITLVYRKYWFVYPTILKPYFEQNENLLFDMLSEYSDQYGHHNVNVLSVSCILFKIIENGIPSIQIIFEPLNAAGYIVSGDNLCPIIGPNTQFFVEFKFKYQKECTNNFTDMNEFCDKRIIGNCSSVEPRFFEYEMNLIRKNYNSFIFCCL